MKGHRFFGGITFAGFLFLAMLLLIEVGRQVGQSDLQRLGESSRTGVGVVDGAVYALLSLLIGFTFAGATSRFNNRRQLIIAEVNAISTAWQRVGLVPAGAQDPIRAEFRKYLDALVAIHSDPQPSDLEGGAREDLTRAQHGIWEHSVAACFDPSGERARMLLLPSVNEMFDAVDTERLLRPVHAPPMIFAMLAVAALASALFAGYALATAPDRHWMYIVGVAGTISFAVYVIVELEYPEKWLIRMASMHRALVELRATMG